MKVSIVRLVEGQTRFGLWHNLTTEECVPYYVELHALGLCLRWMMDRREG